MRLDRLREGLISPGAMAPGVTANLGLPAHAAVPPTPRVNALGDPQEQFSLLMRELLPQKNSTEPLRRAMQPAALETQYYPGPGRPPPHPAMQPTLNEMSGMVQGTTFGRPMSEIDIPKPVPRPAPEPVTLPPPGGEDADLPSRPPTGPANNDIADAMKLAPLQNMQPVDPSYGDLFKKLRPY
jgi:hypothetical protein